MKQHEAVIQTLERLGGQATLAELYKEVMIVKDCKWATRRPFASIRRIVQTRPEIFKVRPGLWALRSYKSKLGLSEYRHTGADSEEIVEQNHAYYQGLLVIVGNLMGRSTFVPNQDKNKLFIDRPLKDLRTLQEIPSFGPDWLVKRSETIDVLWFNSRMMPDSLHEVEHNTDMQNSLLKFSDLQDFNTRMVIVADEHRRGEFDRRIAQTAFREIRARVEFEGYNFVVKQYEYQVLKAEQGLRR